MRLIDADELLEYIKTWYCDKCDSNNGVRCGSCLMDNALIEIDRHEVVDAVPVVRCKGDDTHTCEHCHHAHASTVLDDKPLFCIECEQFKSSEDTCDKWQEKHKERN